MAWELYKTKGSRVPTPKLTIWSRGQIAINQSAIDQFNINNYDYIILYFDKDLNKIGFKFTNNDKREGVIKFQRRKKCISFGAKEFLKQFNIDYSKCRNFDIKEEGTMMTNYEENDFYTVQL